jgi:hypothetical protein
VIETCLLAQAVIQQRHALHPEVLSAVEIDPKLPFKSKVMWKLEEMPSNPSRISTPSFERTARALPTAPLLS